MENEESKIKSRLVFLVVVIALIAGFGAFLHSPPSVVDIVTGATPKEKKAAQESAKLEGCYLFCMNSAADQMSDERKREQLKALVSGETEEIRIDTNISFAVYVSETDYALVRYAESLCKRLSEHGVKAKVRQYNSTMLRSRVVSGQYEVFLAANDLISKKSLENADYILLNSSEMRRQ